jgi:NADPH:quinone reductase-like Zn-dependent oxidoreductase
MRAAVFHQCGDASQIKIEEVPEPKIGPGQALIRVHASAFNHLELWALHGPADESYQFPMWTGSDIAGVIERTRAGCHRLGSGRCGCRQPIAFVRKV